ncbi:hypothetical protein AAMO2058_000641100 [Amorphochlora amoebiformis]
MLVARVLRAPRDLRRAVDTARRSFAVTSSEVECRNRVLRKEWEKDRIGFWEKASHHLNFFKRPTETLNTDNPPFYKWFPGGKFNACYNCVDVHVENGRGKDKALIYDSPVTGTSRTFTFKELQDEVAATAGMLRSLGVEAGDRVVIYMPMIPEAITAMLACARLGAIHSVVFGGFAAKELAVRIDDAEPKVVLSASCGIEGKKIVQYKPLLDKAIEISRFKPEHSVVKQRPESPCSIRDVQKFDEGTLAEWDWDQLIGGSKGTECVAVDSDAPLYILYTSGSTGQPKGVLRDNAGYCVALKWCMENFMMVSPGEVYWAASDVGWVVGHSFIVYGPLLHGATTVLYEGKPIGTPDPGAFWRVVEKYQVRSMFTAPTALRAIRKEDPNGEYSKKHDLSSLKHLFCAGERCDPCTVNHFADRLDVHFIDNWWQTETGWTVCGMHDTLLGAKPGSASLPLPGYDVHVLDDHGSEVEDGKSGSLAIKLPLPPGSFINLHNDEKRYQEYFSEFSGYYSTGDAGVIDTDGYVTVLERTDDVINVAAHRLSSGQIEEAIKSHPAVNDCAVVGAHHSLKGQVPVAFVVLIDESQYKEQETIFNEIKMKVREDVGPIASLKGIIAVTMLPKTRSGKVLRKNIRAMIDGKQMKVPGTIEEPAAMDVIKDAIVALRM